MEQDKGQEQSCNRSGKELRYGHTDHCVGQAGV
jgi:hypothetical protein